MYRLIRSFISLPAERFAVPPGGGAQAPVTAPAAAPAATHTAQEQQSAAATEAVPEAPLRWIDATTLPIEGRGWSTEAETPFDRFPARARQNVRPVLWDLSLRSAGMLLRFSSDSSRLSVNLRVRMPEHIGMGHMPATGVSGVDLYSRGADGSWQFISSLGIRIAQDNAFDTPFELFKDKPRQGRDYLLYLPLYNGVSALQLGIDTDAVLQPLTVTGKPIVCYGTSITQGACASRPGMAYTAILGRKLGREVINLGFSGNALIEPEVADLLAELDPAVYVLNPLPNLQPEEVYPRLKHAIATLRKRHRTTPIILVESITYADAWFTEPRASRAQRSNAALRQLFDELHPTDAHLHYVEGSALLGTDNEATVDGTHPNDIGFARIAAQLEPALRNALASAAE